MAPSDPLEAMLVEQLALGHHAIGRTHVRAATAGNADAAKIYYSAAARLQGEFRQSLLALKAYRSTGHPPVRPSADPSPEPPATGTAPSKPEAAVPVPGPECGTGLRSKNRLKGYFDGFAKART